MRLLVVAFLSLVVAGCTCSGCHSQSATDAGVATQAVTAQDGGALAEADDAGDDEDDADEPDENAAIPQEVEQNAMSAEELVAAFAKDCSFSPAVVFEDMNGPNDAGECDARAFDQNCSPDVFGCWDESERCRDACASPCGSCEAACASSCESCKVKCHDGACTTTCAEQRNDCRLGCLRRLERCRSKDCQVALDKCEADAEERTREKCPDCVKLRECLQSALETGGESSKCRERFPNDAAECLEWCAGM